MLGTYAGSERFFFGFFFCRPTKATTDIDESQYGWSSERPQGSATGHRAPGQRQTTSQLSVSSVRYFVGCRVRRRALKCRRRLIGVVGALRMSSAYHLSLAQAQVGGGRKAEENLARRASGVGPDVPGEKVTFRLPFRAGIAMEYGSELAGMPHHCKVGILLASRHASGIVPVAVKGHPGSPAPRTA
jgi:hypothetical protein